MHQENTTLAEVSSNGSFGVLHLDSKARIPISCNNKRTRAYYRDTGLDIKEKKLCTLPCRENPKPRHFTMFRRQATFVTWRRTYMKWLDMSPAAVPATCLLKLQMSLWLHRPAPS